jgi:shikimate kinase
MVKNIIALAGAPCSGKTSVGRILSLFLDAEFIDTDHVIEKKTGRTIRWIFRHQGEKAFREIETEILSDIFRKTSAAAVVALGGGTLLNRDNLTLVKENALLFTLVASVNTLVTRDCSNRPLASDSHAFRQLMRQRKQHYLSLGNSINTDNRSAEQVASAVMKEALPLLSR